MYKAVLSHGMSIGLAHQQLSSLLGIMQQVHHEAVAERLAMEVSFQRCGDLLLMHALERPPKSAAIFSLKDMQEVLKYLQNTYFLHYALYQYVFTPENLLDFEAVDAASLTERPSVLPPLSGAVTEEDWARQVAAQRQTVAEQEATRIQQVRRPLPRTRAVVELPALIAVCQNQALHTCRALTAVCVACASACAQPYKMSSCSMPHGSEPHDIATYGRPHHCRGSACTPEQGRTAHPNFA